MSQEETVDNSKIIQENSYKMESAADLKKVLAGEFASGVTRAYVNSIDKEVAFKEITVLQQKSLSRMMMGNEQRKDIVYDSQCAIINQTCVDEGFDIYNLTEFDRLKMLIILYQSNMFQNRAKFTCKNCGVENSYVLSYTNVINKLDKFDLDFKKFVYENDKFKYEFTVGYPSVKLVSNYYKYYYGKHKNSSKREEKVNDSMSNIEYINLYVKQLKFTNKSTGTVKDIDFTRYSAAEIQDLMQVFPQDVLFSDNGVLTFITKEYLQKLNDAFDKHVCYSCGTVQEEEGENRVESFL